MPAVTPPTALPDDVAALRGLVLMAWAERDAERAENGRLIEERDQLAGQNDRLRHLLRQLQRMQFGRRSEKLDPDQFNLALEDLEQAMPRAKRNRTRPIRCCARRVGKATRRARCTAGAPTAGRDRCRSGSYRLPVLRRRDACDRRGLLAAARRHSGAIPGDR